MGCHALLQGIFRHSGMEPGSPECSALQVDSLLLSHWMALHGTARSFIELYKPFRHDKAVIHESYGFSSSHGRM